jgi:hypothetical protein
VSGEEIPGDGPGADLPAADAGRTSWVKVIAVTGGICAVVAAGAWALRARPPQSPQTAELTAQLPSASPQDQGAGQEVQSGGHAGAAPKKAKKPKKPYHGPPVLSVQYFDTSQGMCSATYAGSVNVVITKGVADDVDAEVRIPVDHATRPQALIPIHGEWSTVMSGLPTKRTVKLVIIAKGPGGTTGYARDISHPCPGKPMDKVDPDDLGTKIARQRIKQHMFKSDYDFSFDFSGKPDADSGDHSGKTKPSATPNP